MRRKSASSSKYNSDKPKIVMRLRPQILRKLRVPLSLQSVVWIDLVVLHRYRRHVTMGLFVRHVAAVDWEINGFGRRWDTARTLQGDTTTVNKTISHGVFSRTFAHNSFLFTGTAWLKVSQRVSHEKHIHPHVTTCLIVRCLSVLWPLPLFRVSPPFVHSLNLLHPGYHPPCVKTAEYRTLSQVVSPSSSTTSIAQRLLQRSSRMYPST